MRNVQLPRSPRRALHSDASASSDTRRLRSLPNEAADTEAEESAGLLRGPTMNWEWGGRKAVRAA